MILLLGLALSCSGPSGDKGEALPSSPHPVVLLVLDGVRAESLGEVSALDALASEAVRFDWAFAQAPDFAASMASTFTGLYPTTHGLVEADERLTEDALTLAELLNEAGIRTAAFLETAAAIDDRGLEQGFSTFETGPGAFAAASKWLVGNPGKAHFLLAATDIVSAAVTDGDAAGAQARYDEALAGLDSQIRGLLEALAQSDPKRNATVVVLATRGSEPDGSSAGIGPSLDASRMRVPLMIRLPRGGSAQTVDRIVELTDLTPTLLELTGTSVPLDLQGSSLLPLIEGAGTPPYIAFGESPHRGGQQFAVLGGYRLILSKEGDQAALYNLAADPLEASDIAESEPKRAEVLRDYLGAWEKMIAAASLDPERRIEDLDDATLEQLKSLGYIQ